MSEKLITKKFVFTVEGETEQWYLYWLRDKINECEGREYNISIDAKVQQSPGKFYKRANARATPLVFHICDVESNEDVHVEKFQNILSEMKDAKTNKGIEYRLGYSNFAFELWMVLHKRNCNGPLNDRSKYLSHVSKAFGENFEDLAHYKREDDFKRCLSSLTLDDVREAIRRADVITNNNKTNGNPCLKYKGYSYYRDNPALSIHEVVKLIFKECGI